MKRSEMLEIMAHKFYYMGANAKEAAIAADSLLREMEERGMTPPPNSNNKFINEWEKE